MRYETLHFGPVECPAAETIRIPGGIAPFVTAQLFVLLSDGDEAPFAWLQSLDDPKLAFVVVPLQPLFPDCAAAVLGRSPVGTSDHIVLGIVVVNSDPSLATVNLLAPLLVDFATMQARQVVLDGPAELARVSLQPAMSAAETTRCEPSPLAAAAAPC